MVGYYRSHLTSGTYKFHQQYAVSLQAEDDSSDIPTELGQRLKTPQTFDAFSSSLAHSAIQRPKLVGKNE